jgi:FAD/FMN-containing dehydrogenase
LTGTLVLPTDSTYATAKQIELMQFDSINPQAIAYCATPADVSLCLGFAQQNGVSISVRSGGHSLGGYSLGRGLVVDVSRMNSISLSGGSVQVGAGAENVDVLDALAPSGLALVGGACPTVGAGGFVQGGGLGFLSRSYGMACDQLTAVQLVTASGRQLTASATQNTDLFWALRGGGGGNFGVVTGYTFTAAPLSMVSINNLVFDPANTVDMLDGFQNWLVDAPWTIGGAAVVALNDAAAGNPVSPTILLVSTGSATELASEVNRLLTYTGAAVAQNPATMPYQALMTNIYGCGSLSELQCHLVTAPSGQLPRTAYARERSRLFSEPVSRAMWTAALSVFDSNRMTGQTHELQVISMGGAVGDRARTDTAFVHRDSLFTAVFSGVVQGSSASSVAAGTAQAFVDAGFNAIDPYSNGETYQNFIDPQLSGWRSAYYAENYSRLASVKQSYDPNGVFRFAQSIL